jgi:class 3 adenylate cyclase
VSKGIKYLVKASRAYGAQKNDPKWLERMINDKLRAQGIDPAALFTSIDAVAAAAEDERPDLRRHAAPDGTVTLLFTDIESSTALNERMGDEDWVRLLHVHNAILREQVRAHEGFEVKSEGDGFMVAFRSARTGVQCAVAMQRAVTADPELAAVPIRLRIGLHTGEAIRDRNDFYGRHVNLASRIADEARGGEVLVSSLLKELTEGSGELEFGPECELDLKGLEGYQRVYSVVWRPAGDGPDDILA